MQARCSSCGAPYEANEELLSRLAGKDVLCPACGGVISVPRPPGRPDAPEEPVVDLHYAPAPPPAPPAYARAAFYFQPSWPDPRALLHVKLIGIFNLIAGGLSALWSLLILFYAVMFGFMTGITSMAPAGGGAAGSGASPRTVFSIIGGVGAAIFVLAAAAALLMILAGVFVLRRRPNARKWAFAAGIVSCLTVWNYCLYPVVLASGIYTIVAVWLTHVREYLDYPASEV